MYRQLTIRAPPAIARSVVTWQSENQSLPLGGRWLPVRADGGRVRRNIGNCQQPYGLPAAINGLSHALSDCPPDSQIPRRCRGRAFKSQCPKEKQR